MEIWKDIPGYEQLYQVSNHGRVKSLKKWDINKRAFVNEENILTPFDNGHGYLVVGLTKCKKKKNKYIHRLVACAFVDNPNNQKYVNHIDFDTKNNDSANLEWCSQKNNVLHSSERMRKPKSVTHTNTGEKYITYREKNNKYRVVIAKKEYGSFSTLDEAIKKRDEILKEVMPECLRQL